MPSINIVAIEDRPVQAVDPVHTKWKRPGRRASVRPSEIRDLHVLVLEAQAERPVQRSRREVVIHDGPELGAAGGGQVPLVLEDHVVGAQSDLVSILFF